MKRTIYALLAMASLGATGIFPCQGTTLPELPRVFMQTAYAPPTNPTIYRPQTSADFQTALNTCKLGDIIELSAGATYKGPFTLPNKTSGTGWIYITSSALAKLPSPCTRVSPSDAPNMPSIVVSAGAGGTIQTASGAHHYRFVGIEFKPVDGNFVYNIVQIGNAETTESALPNNIILDRCYVHGDSVAGSRRGVMMNGAAIAVIDSYISDCKEAGADTQAAGGWSATGPIKIVNNYLEAAGENVMFGGSDPTIPNAVPSDIEIRCNYFFKPLSWMTKSWVVKNLLEFKNAQRVLVEGNRFENCWPSGQNGFALLLTPRNQNNTAPWCVTQDITIRRNVFVNIAQGINLLGRDAPNISQRTTRVLIRDNVINAVKMANSDGRMFQILGDPEKVTIDHNTAFCPVAYVVADGTPKTDSFSFTNNIVSQGVYGFIGTGTANANTTLAAFFNANWTISNNAVIGGSTTNYPSGNYFPPKSNVVGFVDSASGNFRLISTSPYKNAGNDGRDLGADMDSIQAASTYICNKVSASVESVSPASGARLYPTPSDRYLNVVLEGSLGQEFFIEILDELGHSLVSRVERAPGATVSTADLSNGVYLLRIESFGDVTTSRFVVRH